MKVKELIERLKTLDPELMVVRSGYEGGVEEATEVDVRTIALNVNPEWYYGSHELLDSADECPEYKRASAAYIH